MSKEATLSTLAESFAWRTVSQARAHYVAQLTHDGIGNEQLGRLESALLERAELFFLRQAGSDVAARETRARKREEALSCELGRSPLIVASQALGEVLLGEVFETFRHLADCG